MSEKLLGGGEERGEIWRRFGSARGKGSVLLKEPFVAPHFPLLCPVKGDIDSSQAYRKTCIPSRFSPG